jgi:hypothetical protein
VEEANVPGQIFATQSLQVCGSRILTDQLRHLKAAESAAAHGWRITQSYRHSVRKVAFTTGTPPQLTCAALADFASVHTWPRLPEPSDP